MSAISETMAKIMDHYEEENWLEHEKRASVLRRQTVHYFLDTASEQLEDRASQRDAPDGERSMRRCVEAFNALYGTALTETQGWQFMSLLKKARAAQGEYRADDFVDDVAYAALAGESESRP
jgi:hypothetical protein